MSEDFAELFASYESQRKTALKAGDKVSGTVISIGQKSVFVDCGASVDGIVDREELLNEAGDYSAASPIEPSAQGGAKISAAIVRWVKRTA